MSVDESKLPNSRAEKVMEALRKIAPEAYMTRAEVSWWDNPADENDDAGADTVEFDGRFKVADLEAALLAAEQPFGAIVAAERERQIAKGYTAEHDDEHSDSDLVSFIVNRLERLNRCVIARDRYEQALVEVAALAAAAFERSRRKPDEVVE